MDIFINIIRERSLVNNYKLEKLLQEHDSPTPKKKDGES